MFKKIANELWAIPTLIFGFFLFVEIIHMQEHKHCRGSEVRMSEEG